MVILLLLLLIVKTYIKKKKIKIQNKNYFFYELPWHLYTKKNNNYHIYINYTDYNIDIIKIKAEQKFKLMMVNENQQAIIIEYDQKNKKYDIIKEGKIYYDKYNIIQQQLEKQIEKYQQKLLQKELQKALQKEQKKYKQLLIIFIFAILLSLVMFLLSM